MPEKVHCKQLIMDSNPLQQKEAWSNLCHVSMFASHSIQDVLMLPILQHFHNKFSSGNRLSLLFMFLVIPQQQQNTNSLQLLFLGLASKCTDENY